MKKRNEHLEFLRLAIFTVALIWIAFKALTIGDATLGAATVIVFLVEAEIL